MTQHIPRRKTVYGMIAGVLLIAAGCHSDKPWPYSPSLGPEGPACFPCSLWGGYFPTCWDRWPADAPKCPPCATGGPPEASPGVPAPASPFTPEPTPAGKPGTGPKPPTKPPAPAGEPGAALKPLTKPPAKPPAPDTPGKEETMVEIEDADTPAAPKTLPTPGKPFQPSQLPDVSDGP